MLRRFTPQTCLAAVLAVSGLVQAHVVPNMLVEADFAEDRSYTLRINVDPRTFLAADPTTLPPVPGSWYREQTPEQIAATHAKAQEYLAQALSLLLDGQKSPLPSCEIRAIDGEDNNPLKAETQEVHLLATARGILPAQASGFQLEVGKSANTSLILLHSLAGNAEQRPQVLFPGETSRTFPLKFAAQVAVPAPTSPQAETSGRYLLAATLLTVGILVFVGRRLLKHYRFHHRAHRKPPSM